MALNVSDMGAKKTTLPARVSNGRKGADLGPNPFLDKEWDFNLKNSYELGEGYEITVDGGIEMLPAVRGAVKGQPVEKLTGDAYVAERLIRKAADELGIGSTVKCFAGKAPSKGGDLTRNVPKGKVLIMYMGMKRKQSRKTAEAVASEVAPADQVDSETAGF